MTERTTPDGTTPRPWQLDWEGKRLIGSGGITENGGYNIAVFYGPDAVGNAALAFQAVNERDELIAALNYVADMTYILPTGDWAFKPGYDPQVVLDALNCVEGL